MYNREVPEGVIRKMKRKRFVYLCEFLYKYITKGDINKAVSILYNSKTFECLQETETDLWWKSEAELKYLLQKELEGNMEAWEKQAF